MILAENASRSPGLRLVIEALVGDDGFIAPGTAGIDHIGLDRVVGRAFLSLDQSGLVSSQGAWQMAATVLPAE